MKAMVGVSFIFEWIYLKIKNTTFIIKNQCSFITTQTNSSKRTRTAHNETKIQIIFEKKRRQYSRLSSTFLPKEAKGAICD